MEGSWPRSWGVSGGIEQAVLFGHTDFVQDRCNAVKYTTRRRGTVMGRAGKRLVAAVYVPFKVVLFENLSALASINHARHSVRIKKSTSMSMLATSFRRDPSKDDVIFWTNGRLGCSLPWTCSWSWVRAGSSGTMERSSSNVTRSRGTSC